MNRRARAPGPYYVALAVLIAGLVTGHALFLLLATRPTGGAASYRVRLPVPDDCPIGRHTTDCYRFDITNTGDGVGVATCTVTADPGTRALFPNGNPVTNVLLSAGETRGVFVSVTGQGSDTVTPPRVACTDA